MNTLPSRKTSLLVEPLADYAELHCLSNFSFLRGASHPAELVEQAHRLNYRALAITDECSLAGVVKAHVAAQARSLQLIIGSEFQLDGHTLIALAPCRQAYSELSALITLARRRAEKGEYRIKWRDLAANLRHGLLIWLPSLDPQSDQWAGEQLASGFAGRLWLGVEHLLTGNEPERYQSLCKLARRWRLPMTACGNVHMHTAQRKPLQDVLTAIRHNCSVMALGERRFRNAEHHLRSRRRLRQLYPPALLAETLAIAERCRFSLDELRYEYPPELVPKTMTATSYLRWLVEDGVKKRWPEGESAQIRRQIEAELALIAELRYEYYFLTVQDVVAFARTNDILCQGRGSAANSVVCYCLFITEVSPAQVSLLFERFISKERNEPPDIDVDFEHERREEVIQYIYKKYSRERAALAATVITYRPRSAVRDVGKALGLDAPFIEQLSQSLAWWDRRGDLERRFVEQGISEDGQLAGYFFQLLREIIGFPRHLSQHVGGFIITKSPISTLVPVENAAMPERTVIQWDKEDIEALGLLKVDVLALGMLSALHRSFQLIGKHQQIELHMDTIPKEDPATYQMLCRGDSIGVFQVESRAQMAMLPRLKPRCFYDLVIEIAIVRPGPIQGDMVHPYLRRRDGIEDIDYPSAEIESVLKRTLGVPIFQEQVIKLAMVAAGFSGGEADQLRRAMASWGKTGRLHHFEKKLIDGMTSRGYSLEFAQRIFRQIQGFGEYGFPESHSASFALLAYVSAWLKRHHPAAFYCALLNSQPMGFYSPSQLVQDARRHRVEVRPVDVCHSEWDHSLESGAGSEPALRLGLRLIKGLSQQGAERILNARRRQPPGDIQRLARLAQLNRHDLSALAAADAFRSLSTHRRQAHWQALAVEETRPLLAHPTPDAQVALEAPGEVESLKADYNSTGLTLRRHPMTILRERFAIFRRCKTHREICTLGHRRFVRTAGIVTGRQRPGSTSGVIFLTLEDETGNSNIVIWRNVQQRYREALLKSKLLMVKGVVETDDAVVHVIAGELVDCSELLESTRLKSRDFR